MNHRHNTPPIDAPRHAAEDALEHSGSEIVEGALDPGLATLTDAQIQFHTNDEDKDWDTNVTIEVQDFNQVTAAYLDNNFGQFRDGSTTNWLALEVLDASTRDDLQRGNVHIHIDPNGNDTWRFNFKLNLIFSDSTTLSAGADNMWLSEDNRDLTLGLKGIVR